MAGKMNPLFVILIIAGLLMVLNKGFLFTMYSDDFVIEDDFLNEGYTLSNWDLTCSSGQGGCPMPIVTPDGLNFPIDNTGGDAHAVYLQNLKGRDVKLSVSAYATGTGSDECNGGDATIYFGGQRIASVSTTSCKGTSPTSATILVEMIKDTLNQDLFYIYVNGAEVNQITIPENEAYISVTGSGGSYRSGSAPGGSSATLHYLKSRPFFNCLLEENEVFVRVTFGGGTSFDINDLENLYTPPKSVTKFCLDSYPAILRSTEPGGGVRADLRGDITRSLARKETITVPDNTYLEVSWAVLYEEGLRPPCLEGEVYDLDKKVCEDFLVEREPEVIVIREREYVTIGKNQKHFVNSLIIGNKEIDGDSLPQFICEPREIRDAGGNCNTVAYQCEQNEECINNNQCRDIEPSDWNAPYPHSNCWKTTGVSYDGQSHIMFDSETVSLNDYLDLKLIINAHYEADEGKVTSGENNYILTLKNYDFIESFAIQEPSDKYWVILNSNRQMCFDISNDLASFSSTQAGYRLRIERLSLIQDETITMNEKAILIGDTQICIDIDSSELGKVIYEAEPYFKLGDEMFFDNERVVYSYEIVDKIPTNVTIIYQDRDCRDFGCPSGTSCKPVGINYVCKSVAVCGNGICESGETAVNCASDCGDEPTCIDLCGEWSSCTNGIQTRTCGAGSGCPESKSCEIEKCSFFEKKKGDGCELNIGLIAILIAGLVLLGGRKK